MTPSKKSEYDFEIAVDTREKLPYDYKNGVRKKLDCGDYSIVGHEDKIVIERKSLSDAYSTFGAGRKRFLKELEKLAKIDYAVIVLESTWDGIIRDKPKYSRLSPMVVLNSLLSWSIRYDVRVMCVGSRATAKAITRRMLEHYWEKKIK